MFYCDIFISLLVKFFLMTVIADINVDQLDNTRYQFREVNDEHIDQLAESMLSRVKEGLSPNIEPIVVCIGNTDGDTTYIVLAGHSRVLAARKVGIKKLKAEVLSGLKTNEKTRFDIAVTTNILRKNMSDYEIAKALDYAITIQQRSLTEVAEALGLHKATASNLLRCLKAVKEVQESWKRGIISTGHVKALLQLDEEEQRKMLKKIIDNNLPVRIVEQMISSKRKKEEFYDKIEDYLTTLTGNEIFYTSTVYQGENSLTDLLEKAEVTSYAKTSLALSNEEIEKIKQLLDRYRIKHMPLPPKEEEQKEYTFENALTPAGKEILKKMEEEGITTIKTEPTIIVGESNNLELTELSVIPEQIPSNDEITPIELPEKPKQKEITVEHIEGLKEKYWSIFGDTCFEGFFLQYLVGTFLKKYSKLFAKISNSNQKLLFDPEKKLVLKDGDVMTTFEDFESLDVYLMMVGDEE